jgi:hypothetical protein
VGDDARGEVADTDFEEGVPVVGGGGRTGNVENQGDFGLGVPGAVAGHELADGGGLAPVDIAGVLAVAHAFEAQDIFAGSAAWMVLEAWGGVSCGLEKGDGIDRRIRDEVILGVDLAGLFEESKREAGSDAKPCVVVVSSAEGGTSVGGDLGRRGADLEEEAAFVRGLGDAEVFDLDGVGGDFGLGVDDFDLDNVGTSHLGADGEPSAHGQAAEGELAEEATDDDEGEEHSKEQVEEVIGGIDRGEADAEGDADEELALAGDSNLAIVGEARPEGHWARAVPGHA